MEGQLGYERSPEKELEGIQAIFGGTALQARSSKELSGEGNENH